jgi:hypothetical protein
MDGIYYYEFRVGTAHWSRYGLDDRTARRLLARWLRLAWPRYKARKAARFPGSMADAEDNGWDGPPLAQIGRTYCKSATHPVIPCVKATIIEEFPVTPESILELSRVWDRIVEKTK